MFEKILLATDFSRYALRILDFVADFPGVEEIVLLHVFDATHPSIASREGLAYNAEIEEARAQLDLQAKYLRGQGLKARAIVAATMGVPGGPDGIDLQEIQSHIDADVTLRGDVRQAIQSIADKEGASLVVMGARGKGLVKEILLGSVLKDVLRYGDTDLLIMRHKILEGLDEMAMEKYGPKIFSRLLVTTDFSDASDVSLSLVKSLEGVDEVALAHIVTRGETQDEVDHSLYDAAKMLRTVQEDLEKSGLKATVHVDSGSAAEKINAIAEKEDVSLIIMSSHGKGWLQQLKVGSTAFDVAKTAVRPLLVVRTDKGVS
jgi:nucleotide-binding universal stress UspA family protein